MDTKTRAALPFKAPYKPTTAFTADPGSPRQRDALRSVAKFHDPDSGARFQTGRMTFARRPDDQDPFPEPDLEVLAAGAEGTKTTIACADRDRDPTRSHGTTPCYDYGRAPFLRSPEKAGTR